MLDRRELLTTAVVGVLGSLALPRRGRAQAATVDLGGGAFLLTAGRTNVLARSTPDGLVVVDSGAPGLGDRVATALGRVAPGSRVQTLYNTHWHEENTGGNEILGSGGATILAHENTRLWMATPTWMPEQDRYRPVRPAAAVPTETFHAEGSMLAGDERVDYGYLVEAHTSGDIFVFFRDANVLAVGDAVSPARDPELDWFTGAWIGGRVDAMDRLLELSDEETRIVPGFGPVLRRAELQAERDVMAEIYDRTVERVRRGDSPEDMLAGGVLDGLSRTWTDPHAFVYAVHKGLWAHHNKLNADVV